MKRHKFSKTDLIKVINSSTSIKEAIEKLGLQGNGNNYKIFRRRAQKFDLDISHLEKYGKEPQKRNAITYEQFVEATKNNITLIGIVKTLGLSTHNNMSVPWVKDKIDELQLNKSHILGSGCRKGTKRPEKTIPLENILVKNSSYTSATRLKNRLIEIGLLKNECSICHLIEWNGKQITLQIDHINGIHDDNRLANLRILCPNCHSQTITYAGKQNSQIYN